MFQNYKKYVPKNIDEIRDSLASMILGAPTFVSHTGYLSWVNLENTFESLNEGLIGIKEQIGEDNYVLLRDMSDRMRAHFEADPEYKTGDTSIGCKIIYEMDDILKEIAHARQIPLQSTYESDD